MSGHLWRGLSRSDVKEFGDLIDEGQAALLIVGASAVLEAVNKAGLKAERQVTKDVQNVSQKDVDQAIQEASKEVS